MPASKKRLRVEDVISLYLRVGRTQALVSAAVMIAVIAVIDWGLDPNYSLGFLYFFPILIAARYMTAWEMLPLALLCAVLREDLGSYPWQPYYNIRILVVMFVYIGAGLTVAELARHRQLVMDQLREIAEKERLRQEAEEQLSVLIESSPAAIITVDSDGKILKANEAAHRMLAMGREALNGKTVYPFLPILSDVVRARGAQFFRTSLQCSGRRRNGELFRASVWFSTYNTRFGPRLAAIVVDTTDDFRDSEEVAVNRLLVNSRILVGAVSHEIRNMCGAIAVVHANLCRHPGLETNEDFKALGTLAEALKKLASAELRPSLDSAPTAVNLHSVLSELRIIVEPTYNDLDMTLEWDVAEELPLVMADHHGLLQVFLNLASNSRQAMEEAEERILSIHAEQDHNLVTVRFADSGSGIARPESLFRPFQPGVQTGLGLYVSRAIVRSFGGDLRYEATERGACFTVSLHLSSEGVSTSERKPIPEDSHTLN